MQILKSWAMDPMDEVRLTLVVDQPVAIYSGMVPGFVAGQYPRAALEIDTLPLARRAGARVIMSRAVRLDADARVLHVADRPPIRYDVASLNVGSRVNAPDAGDTDVVVPTRPIGALMARIDALIQRVESGQARGEVVVVGGGAGGVELALTLSARLTGLETKGRVTLIEASGTLLEGFPRSLARRVERAAHAAGVVIRLDCRVTGVDGGTLLLRGPEGPASLRCDAALWATGAAAPPLVADSGIETDARGFALVRDSLQLVQHDDVFAVGDCASMLSHPDLAKAGVYAVRQGRVLNTNLRARLRGRALVDYRPQRDFLMLLNTGRGTAIGSKRGLSFEGRWVWRLKDRIDRAFVRRFQVLAAEGEREAPVPPMTGGGEMICGGCAAKVGATVLSRALKRLPGAHDPSVILGLEKPDDAAIIDVGGERRLVVSVDGFRAFTDDPFLVGRVAAINAVSDIHATGGMARHALAMVNLPLGSAAQQEEMLFQVLAGVRAALDPLGVTLVGGHTTAGGDLMVGLSVSGQLHDDERPFTIDGLVPGDVLVLTKPIGSGALLAADMRGMARGPWIADLYRTLTESNAPAAEVARQTGVRALTDVTGFGLAGHLLEMVSASGVSAELWLASVPLLAGAAEVTSRGVRSTFFEANAERKRVIAISADAADVPALELLFDPQTSGGLLWGVTPARLAETLAALSAAGLQAAAAIGTVTEKQEAPLRVVAG